MKSEAHKHLDHASSCIAYYRRLGAHGSSQDVLLRHIALFDCLAWTASEFVMRRVSVTRLNASILSELVHF